MCQKIVEFVKKILTFIIKNAPNNCQVHKIKVNVKYINPKDKKYVEQIDFNAISNNFKLLKGHKGLKIVDIKSKDGSEVTITV